MSARERPHHEAPFLWPQPQSPGNGPLVFLLESGGRFETRLLRDAIAAARPIEIGERAYEIVLLPRGQRPIALEARVAGGDDPLFAPLRVAWLPKLRADGSRRARLPGVLFGDPREPGPLRQRLIAARNQDRVEVVAGEPATLSELRARWRESGALDADAVSGLADFVSRRASLALERAERRLRGARYKVPRLVREDILARPAFRGALARTAHREEKSESAVAKQAARYLREIAAAHSPTMIDLAYQFFRFMYTRGYQRIAYDAGELERVTALMQRHPVVFLPSHKSNLDHPSLYAMLFENGLPPTHTAGGINMNFLPLGPLVRRSGVFFIRRSFKDNPVYKLVLRHYIDYLIEKRFSLEWYVEGGRSRSGKLLPPRFGLLAYVVDAYRRGKSDDVILVPISISYDQIQDVDSYVSEQRGGQKESESFSWMLRLLRRLRRLGEIEIRFGEALSLAKSIGPPRPDAAPDTDETNLSLQKIAFDVCRRINGATPVTPTSLVTLALLSVGDRALSADESVDVLDDLTTFVEQRDLPRSGRAIRNRADIESVLTELRLSGVVRCFAEGPEPVYRIGEDQHLAAAYYRNTVIHFFTTTAIAELALIEAAELETGDRVAVFFAAALRIRDLLKFDFFFPDRERFGAELRLEMSHHDTLWESAVREDAGACVALARRMRPLCAHAVLRPFLDAYRIVADALLLADDGAAPFSAERCLALGKQYVLQRRIGSAESVSTSYFEAGQKLARQRGLMPHDTPEDPALREGRERFAEELAECVRRCEVIEAFAIARHAGIEV